MKILITGASGFIGKHLGNHLADHDLVLWSRTPPSAIHGIEYVESGDLANTGWWRDAKIPPDVDAVIHLAEPIKTKLSRTVAESVIESHCAFLTNACRSSRLVIYPDTAYRYDRRVKSANRTYLDIKRRVTGELSAHPSFISPVIHPLIDSGGALSRLQRQQRKVPLINPFSAFNARIPVLSIPELLVFFRDHIENGDTRIMDWYGQIPTVCDLMAGEGRRDMVIPSQILRQCLGPLAGLPAVSILLNGRALPDSPNRSLNGWPGQPAPRDGSSHREAGQ